jgi:hypothetical protein
MTDVLEGACACGAVRNRLASSPIVVHCCHCRFCQRMSGSAFGLNALIESDRSALLGETEPEPVATPSTHPRDQVWRRCPRCRVAVWSEHAELGPRVPIINLGTLEVPERLAPDVHCWTASKHPWILIRRPRFCWRL